MPVMRQRLAFIACVIISQHACFSESSGDASTNRTDASDRPELADGGVVPLGDAGADARGDTFAADSADASGDSGMIDLDADVPVDASFRGDTFDVQRVDAVVALTDAINVDAQPQVEDASDATVSDSWPILDVAIDVLPACPPGFTLCGAGCTDLETSPANCGACGASCVLSCSRGVCQDIVMLGAGDQHRCAALRDRSLRCWGDNGAGQLGTGDSMPVSGWTPVAGINNVEEVACGARFSCARATSGAVSCWGANDNGQLGDGSFVARATPSGVREISDSIAIATGLDHACSLGVDRRIRCWGNNEGGALGANSTATRSSAPLEVEPATMYASVSAGFYLTCGLTIQRTVRCWGRNSSGQVGDGTTVDRRVPTNVTLPAPATQIAVGAYHACALLSDRRIACWGHNEAGALGTGMAGGSTVPILVAGIGDAAFIAAGDYHTCAIRADGAVACWGLNDRGQLGDNTQTSRLSAVAVVGAYRAVSLSLRGRHSCAIGTDGRMSCWGANMLGELADGTRIDRRNPTLVRW